MNRGLKALILAGGRGSRLGVVGAAVPKCLLPVYSEPLLYRLLRQVAAAGAVEALISISARHERQLADALEGFDPPLPVRVVVEREPLGTAAALASFAPLLADAPSLLVLGDEYYQHGRPFGGGLAELPERTMRLGALRSNRARLECNIVVDAAGRVVGIKDKPRDHEIRGDLRWACFAAFGPRTLDLATGPFASPHIGDALEVIRAAGACTELIECPELELNINSLGDLLLATLVEARSASVLDAALAHLARVP